MSFMDKAKQAFGQAKDKAGELADQHGDKIDSAIDKGGSFIDEKTHGKYADKVDKVGSKAKEATEKLATQGGADAAPQTGQGGSATSTPDPSEAAGPIPAPEPVDPPEPIRPHGDTGGTGTGGPGASTS